MATETHPDAKQNRKLIPFKLPPDLIERLKARALKDGVPATALVEVGIERELAVREGRGNPPPQPAPSRQQLARATRVEQEARALGLEICARCGHGKSSHWSRGCMAGCPCGERLYRART